jgi:hypothetical protein
MPLRTGSKEKPTIKQVRPAGRTKKNGASFQKPSFA